jgi:type I restriction enzyme S subunit
VPQSWEIRRIGEVCGLKSGGTPNRSQAQYWDNGNIPWVKTGEVDYCLINDTEEKISAAGLANSSATVFPRGTLLMAMYGQGITRGKVALLGVEAATNQACVAIFPHKDLCTKFLYYFFEHKYEYVRTLGHGANQKNLSAEILKGITVAYPSTKQDQNTIVNCLNNLDQKLSVSRRKQRLLSDLFRTLLHQLMTAQIRVHDLDLDGILAFADTEAA